MTILQKISLTFMVVLFFTGLLLCLCAKGADVEKDKQSFDKFCRGIAWVILFLGLSTLIFVLGFIW